MVKNHNGQACGAANASQRSFPISCSGRGSSIIPVEAWSEHKEERVEDLEMSAHDRGGNPYDCCNARAGGV